MLVSRRISLLILLALTSWSNTAFSESDACSNLFSRQPLSWSYYFVLHKPQWYLAEKDRDDDEPLLMKATFNAAGEESIETGPLRALSSLIEGLKRAKEKLYQIYSLRNTVAADDIAALREVDDQLDPSSVVYVTMHDESEAHALIRIVDTTRSTFLRDLVKPARIPIEIEYPDLVLPERALGHNIIELGRLGKSDDVEGDLKALLRTVPAYLRKARNFGAVRNPKPTTIYVEALAPAARLYMRDYGFEKVEKRSSPGKPDRYILKVDLAKFEQIVPISTTDRMYLRN